MSSAFLFLFSFRQFIFNFDIFERNLVPSLECFLNFMTEIALDYCAKLLHIWNFFGGNIYFVDSHCCIASLPKISLEIFKIDLKKFKASRLRNFVIHILSHLNFHFWHLSIYDTGTTLSHNEGWSWSWGIVLQISRILLLMHKISCIWINFCHDVCWSCELVNSFENLVDTNSWSATIFWFFFQKIVYSWVNPNLASFKRVFALIIINRKL